MLTVSKRYFIHSANFIFSRFKYDMTKIPAVESTSPVNGYYDYNKGSKGRRSLGYEHPKNNNDKFGQTLKKAFEDADGKTGESKDRKGIDIKI